MKLRNRAVKSPTKMIRQKPNQQKHHQTKFRTQVNRQNKFRRTKTEEESVEALKSNKLKDKLDSLYTDVGSVPSYSAKIGEFLKNHYVHSTHRRVVRRKNFPRRRVIARFPFEIFMGDLIEFTQYKYQNKGYCFILLLIDCFTKVIYTAPMKSKNQDDCLMAFQSIFDKYEKFPVNLVTDKGKEFFNFKLQSFFLVYGVNHYSTPTKSDSKASIAERAIRTIKQRLQKIFFASNRKKWIDVIDKVTINYNKTPHRSIGMAPFKVNDANRKEVYNRLYPYKNLSVVCRLKEGDKVRKILEKSIFDKGYTQNWTSEVFVIADIRQSNAVCWYKLKTLDNKEVTGIYYYYQLNLVSSNDS